MSMIGARDILILGFRQQGIYVTKQKYFRQTDGIQYQMYCKRGHHMKLVPARDRNIKKLERLEQKTALVEQAQLSHRHDRVLLRMGECNEESGEKVELKNDCFYATRPFP